MTQPVGTNLPSGSGEDVPVTEPLLDSETRRWLRRVFRFVFGPPNALHILIGLVLGVGLLYYFLRLA